MPVRTADDVLQLYTDRHKHYLRMHAGMDAVKAIYDGTATIDLPDMDKATLASVPNLLAQGVDQLGGRIAATLPGAGFTPLRPDQVTSVRRARQASQVVQGWWTAERLKLKMAQRAKHLLAYGMSPVVVRWDPYLKRPVRDVRNPRETYPSPETVNGTYVAADAIFAFTRSIGWLRSCDYGWAVDQVTGTPRANQRPDQEMTLLEYVGPGRRLLVLTGRVAENAYYSPGWSDSPGAGKAVTLDEYLMPDDRYACTVIPTRITLDKPAGLFDRMIGMYTHMAKLMALELIKAEKDIFGDIYLESRPGEIADFVDGPYDGRTGLVNRITGGAVRELKPQPDFAGTQAIDRLERNSRITAGLPMDFSGESGTNIRTGRRGDSILANVIDYTLAEAQDCLAYALEDEDRVAIALAKMYDGDNTRTVFVGTGNAAKAVTYRANEVFETSDHHVTYPVTGADSNALIIGTEQRVGARGMSRWTGMTLDPWVNDPEFEHDRIQYEAIEDAILGGIQQKVASGELPITAAVRIQQLVVQDKYELGAAITKATEEAAALAQTAAPPGPQTPPASAEQLAAGPTAAGLTGAPVPPPEAGQANLAQLFGAMRSVRPLPTASGGRG